MKKGRFAASRSSGSANAEAEPAGNLNRASSGDSALSAGPKEGFATGDSIRELLIPTRAFNGTDAAVKGANFVWNLFIGVMNVPRRAADITIDEHAAAALALVVRW
jgi:hypothetical protein